MSRCTENAEEKLECFNRVLAIDPTNKHALEGIKRFGGEGKRQESLAGILQRSRIALMERQKARVILIVVVVVLAFIALVLVFGNEARVGGGSTSTIGGSSSSSSTVERGWLCDLDGRGEVALWSKPALAFQDGNEVVDAVGMSLRGCVDVTLLDETTNDGILFYRISVGGQRGWVDVEYYYPARLGKPSWSTN
jgi:hypothetical protein